MLTKNELILVLHRRSSFQRYRKRINISSSNLAKQFASFFFNRIYDQNAEEQNHIRTYVTKLALSGPSFMFFLRTFCIYTSRQIHTSLLRRIVIDMFVRTEMRTKCYKRARIILHEGKTKKRTFRRNISNTNQFSIGYLQKIGR